MKRGKGWPTPYTLITCLGLAGVFWFIIPVIQELPRSFPGATYTQPLVAGGICAGIAIIGAWADYRLRAC